MCVTIYVDLRVTKHKNVPNATTKTNWIEFHDVCVTEDIIFNGNDVALRRMVAYRTIQIRSNV